MNEDKPEKKSIQARRVLLLLCVVGIVFALCIGKAVIMVIENGDAYEKKALAQAVGTEKTIVAKPGNILDKNGTYLTASREVYRLILDPRVLDETEENFKGSFDETVKLLSQAFNLPENDFREVFLADTKKSYVRFSKLDVLEADEKKVYDDLVTEFNERRKKENTKPKIAGVWFETEYRMEYPLNNVLSKIIGYTTPDATEGLLGLEAKYNTELRGVNGKEYKYIAEDGSVTTEIVKAQDGYTLETSLDANIAKILQEEIQKFREETGGKRVNIVAMNPQNAEVIAMASDTDYNLNDPRNLEDFFTKEELEKPEETFLLQEAFKSAKQKEKLEAMTYEERLEALTQQVQINYAVSGTYEPGSTAKAMTLAMGIEENIIDPDETYYCDGLIQVGRYNIHCHMTDFCGNLKPIEALARSCNVSFVQIGQKIGNITFAKYQEIFNLGQKTGIDLPGEANTSSLLYKAEDLNTVELSTCSFGQGFNLTMIQMAAAYTSLINGGNYYRPHVVRRILDNEGNVISETQNTIVRKTVSEKTSDYIREALAYVVRKGTGTVAYVDGYAMGGKTGAAEKLPRGTGKYVVSFVGFAPLEKPELLLYVTVDEPNTLDQSQSTPAQQLAHKCFERIFPYMKIYSETDEDAYGYDWNTLKNFSGTSDGQDASFIDDDTGINWLENEGVDDITPEENTKTDESVFTPN